MSLHLVNSDDQAELLFPSSKFSCFPSNKVTITETALGNKLQGAASSCFPAAKTRNKAPENSLALQFCASFKMFLPLQAVLRIDHQCFPAHGSAAASRIYPMTFPFFLPPLPGKPTADYLPPEDL